MDPRVIKNQGYLYRNWINLWSPETGCSTRWIERYLNQLYRTGGHFSRISLDQLDPSFMYTLVMKEILLTIRFEQQHIEESITYCRDVFDGNEIESSNADELERKYNKKKR